MADELPVLVAAVANEQARELEEASRVGRHVWVELRWPPAEQGPHLLEVYTPSQREPMRLLAEPLGTSSERGFALRLYPWEESEPETALVPSDQFIGRQLAGGRFEILSVLGEGSIGAVYRARHTGLGIVVAVKVLHEAFQRDLAFCRRFYDEALALSRLDHPNLVHVYDFGQEPDGLLYLSMAYVDGQTLRSVFAREKQVFETKRMVNVMLQISAGLGHAHARGLIHRDVKPDNVMIVTREDDDGVSVENVKVLDFGFAVPPSATTDVQQRLAGTPVYMSPEQCLGEELDARSDVYACGVMIYELMTGTVPFMGRTADEIRQMHVRVPAPLIAARNAAVDPRVDQLVQKAMAKSREDRHPGMKELRAELKALVEPPPDAAKPPSSARASMPSMPAYRLDSSPRTASSPNMQAASAVPGASLPPTEITFDVNTSAIGLELDLGTPAHMIADALAADASGWLGTLANELDPKTFARRFGELEGAVQLLARRGDVVTLRKISAVVRGLEGRLDRLTRSDQGAGAAIARVANLFRNPEILGPIAARILGPDGEIRKAAIDLVARADVAGAYALYGARTKLGQPDQTARVAFVTTMKSLGPSALPVVRAGLERIFGPAATGEHRGAVELAEDLLLAIPASADEVAGHLVVKYAGSPMPNLVRAAARALPRVWGPRAQPTLLALIHHDEDGVRVAAIVGLREINGVDHEAVQRIGMLFEPHRASSAQLRAAAIAALQSAAAVDAANALIERLRAHALV